MGSISGQHRDNDHSYFWLRLVRGKKIVRVWALDTRSVDLTYGTGWGDVSLAQRL